MYALANQPRHAAGSLHRGRPAAAAAAHAGGHRPRPTALAVVARAATYAGKPAGRGRLDVNALWLRPASAVARSSQQDATQAAEPDAPRAWLAPGLRLCSFAGAVVAGSGLLGSGFNLSGPGSVVAAVGVLAVIVAVHEAGHFTAARLQGVHVTKFAIGFGPALWKFKGPEVEYSLRLFPLGGFVAFPDDDPSSPFPPDDPDLLRNRGFASRAAVISAGVAANLAFAYLVLLAQVCTVGKAESALVAGVRVPEVAVGSAAEQAGLRPGDTILQVGDYVVSSTSEQVQAVVSTIRASPAHELPLRVRRAGDELTLRCVPDVGADGAGRIGVSLTNNTTITHVQAANPADAIRISYTEYMRLAGLVFGGLKQIFTNFGQVAGQVSGPVAIVAAGSEIARTDSAGLFQFAAIVNINLAAVNILPLPALDGGYLLLLIVEAARGRKLPDKVEQTVMASGLLVLMALGAGLVIRDTLSLL